MFREILPTWDDTEAAAGKQYIRDMSTDNFN